MRKSGGGSDNGHTVEALGEERFLNVTLINYS
jgi:hypothetical protein